MATAEQKNPQFVIDRQASSLLNRASNGFDEVLLQLAAKAAAQRAVGAAVPRIMKSDIVDAATSVAQSIEGAIAANQLPEEAGILLKSLREIAAKMSAGSK